MWSDQTPPCGCGGFAAQNLVPHKILKELKNLSRRVAAETLRLRLWPRITAAGRGLVRLRSHNVNIEIINQGNYKEAEKFEVKPRENDN